MNIAISNGAPRSIRASIVTANPWLAAITASTQALRLRRKSWICTDCVALQKHVGSSEHSTPGRRTFHTTIHRSDEPPPRTPFNPKRPESASDPVATTKAADLPSKTDQRRWDISRRTARLMDSVLARASTAGQSINIYTGTDYSGIEAIKREINDQEEKVEVCHKAIDKTRAKHHEAHAKQASSQKEIVSLLERKSSWSPEDLERYMSLVRSEHTDELAVQAAKDGLASAERELENVRAELERMERKQYHEEQIWSDTIRRNSTWVTFGLMGLKIFLLLAQIAIFEPYRRRKIVKEVRRSLDEKAAAVSAYRIERQIDEVVEPKGVPIEALETSATLEDDTSVSLPTDPGLGKQNLPAGGVLPDEASTDLSPSTSDQQNARSSRGETYTDSLQDLFSERIIQVKKVDVTTTALQGAATGVAAMGLLFVLWRPK